jgi:hypothetical protein
MPVTSNTIPMALASLLVVAACDQSRPPTQPSRPLVESASQRSSPSPAPPPRELVEPPRGLDGTLPLKKGMFVASDISCSDPPNAAIRRYDGRGLSGAHTHDCEIIVLEKSGTSYEIDQSCIDAGAGPAPRSSERATIEVHDNLTFTLKRGQGGETFRYCAESLLPPGLRG